MNDFKRALHFAQQELRLTVEQRDKLNMRVMQLQQTIKALAFQCAAADRQRALQQADSCAPPVNETIKAVLRINGRPMSTTEVRDALWAAGFDLGQYTQPLAMLGTTLERLAATDNVIKIPGKPATYQWFEWES